MLISIILPVYNVEQYVEQCLDSIFSQSFTDYEVICINDASTDNSLKVLEKYSDKIKIIKNQKNLGVGLSRNIGLKYAKGDYIHFVDPDDWLENDLYLNLLPLLKAQPDIINFAYQKFDNIYKKTDIVKFKNLGILNKKICPSDTVEAFDNWDRYVWSKLLKKQFLQENNILFNNNKSLSDVEYAAQIYTSCKTLIYTDVVGVNYRLNRQGTLANQAYKSINSIVKSFETNKLLYQNLKPEIKYRLLGFDYYQIRHNIDCAYINGIISTFELWNIIHKLNTKDVDNYIFNDLLPYEFELKLNFRKSLMRKYCPNLYQNGIKLLKSIHKQ